MPRKSRKAGSSSEQPFVTPYGAMASNRRLQSFGFFHPKVSPYHVRAEISGWKSVAHKSASYRNGKSSSVGDYVNGKTLLKVFKLEKFDENCEKSPILGIFAGWQPWGQVMGEELAKTGIIHLNTFSQSYPEGWAAMAQSMAIWNTVSQEFRGIPSGSVFLAVTEKMTYGKFKSDSGIDQSMEKTARSNVMQSILDIHRECGLAGPYWDENFQRHDEESDEDSDDAADEDAFLESLAESIVRVHQMSQDGSLELIDEVPLEESVGDPLEDSPEDSDEEILVSYEEINHQKLAVKVHTKMVGKQLVDMIRSLPETDNLEAKMAHFVDQQDAQRYYMSQQVVLAATFKTFAAIQNRTHLIEVLHFHGTPHLDRRTLAMVVRACPKLKMLGVYACEGFHVGDVLCLLDIVNEVNRGRTKDQPRLDTLDFYPRYNAGSRSHPDSPRDHATYGISWTRLENEVAQRGVFGILLQAVLKSRRMKIKLLMDREGAFMTFLSWLPFMPLQVFSFLDGLYRYLDLVAFKSADKNAIRQALYDTLKPVRMTLESIDQDWPRYYCSQMGETMLFCCSCGCEYQEEFFTAEARRCRPHRRVCAACTLRRSLDEEKDNGKQHAKEIWDDFFPDWEGTEFNLDAPIHQHGNALVRLRSRESVRPSAPLAQVQPDGTVIQRSWIEPLVRDNKIHHDSVQNLPRLRSIFDKSAFKKAMKRAEVIDTRRAVAILIRKAYHGSDVKTFRDVIPEHHADYPESQGPARTKKSLVLDSYNFESALTLHDHFQTEGASAKIKKATETFW